MIWPASRTTTRSASVMTARMMCSTNTTVVPRSRMSPTSRVASAISDGVRPESTSSSMTSRGSEASARASSRNFRWWRFSAAGKQVRAVGEARELEPAAGLALGRAPVPAETAEHARDRDVLADRQVGERPRDLVGPRHAQPGDPVRRAAGHVHAAHDDPPAVRPVMAADHVDERRLAGAVGADEPQDLPFPDLETHPAERLEAAKRLPHVGADEQRRARRPAAGAPPRRDPRRARRAPGGRRRRRRGPPPPHEAGDPAGQEQDGEHEREPDRRAPGHRRLAPGGAVHQDRHQRGADRRAEPVPGAAEHAHQDDVERHDDRERLRDRDVGDEQGVDAARDAGQARREPEREELVAIGRHAQHLRHVLVVVNGEEPGPPAGVVDGVRRRDRHQRDAEGEEVERGRRRAGQPRQRHRAQVHARARRRCAC